MNIKQEKLDPDELHLQQADNNALNEIHLAKLSIVPKHQQEQMLKKAWSAVKENVLKSLPELISDEQFLWYKNNHETWQTSEKFEDALKVHYAGALQTKLENEIRKLIHLISESFFIDEVQPLMCQSKSKTTSDPLKKVIKMEVTTDGYDEFSIPVNSELNSEMDICNEDTAHKDPDNERPEDGDSDDTIKRSPPTQSNSVSCSLCGKEGIEMKDCTCSSRNIEGTVTESQSPAVFKHTSLPHLTFTVYGHECDALINTGVARTFAGNRLVDICQKRGNLSREFDSKEAYLANGSQIIVKEVLQIPLKIGSCNIEHDCIILNGLKNDLLIGMDLLCRLDIKLSFPSSITGAIENYNTDQSQRDYIQIRNSPSTSKNIETLKSKKRIHEEATSKIKKRKKSKSSKSTRGDIDPDIMDTNSETFVVRMGEELVSVPAHIPRTSRRYHRRVPGGVYTARWSRDGKLRSVNFTPKFDDEGLDIKSEDSLILSD